MTLSIREDGRVEWICKHGVGHTIALPYDIIKLALIHDHKPEIQDEIDVHFIHGCDGCCDSDGHRARKVGKY